MNCPLENVYVRKDHNIQGAEMVGQVAWTIPRIYATLEDRQADHQSTMVEVEGKIVEQYVYVLLELGLLTII